MTSIHLVILAGGSGRRARDAGDATPKQFQCVHGRPLWAWSVERLTIHPAVVSLTITCPDEFREELGRNLGSMDLRIPWSLAVAGPTRTASTWSAVGQLALDREPRPDDLIAVHDAARPLADSDLLERLMLAAIDKGGAVPGIMVTDTTVIENPDGRLEYLPRERLWSVQTPQVFPWGIFRDAHAWAAGQGLDFTDDGGLMATQGHRPVVVAGSPDNLKVTTTADLDALRFRTDPLG